MYIINNGILSIRNFISSLGLCFVVLDSVFLSYLKGDKYISDNVATIWLFILLFYMIFCIGCIATSMQYLYMEYDNDKKQFKLTLSQVFNTFYIYFYLNELGSINFNELTGILTLNGRLIIFSSVDDGCRIVNSAKIPNFTNNGVRLIRRCVLLS